MTLLKLVIFFQLVVPNISAPQLRLNKIECNTSGKTVSKYYCYLKSYKRNNPLMNVGYTFVRRVDGVKADIQVQRQSSGEKFNTVLNIENLEICKILKGSSTLPFIKEYIEFVRNSSTNVLESCDRIGDFSISNLSYASLGMVKFFPVAYTRGNPLLNVEYTLVRGTPNAKLSNEVYRQTATKNYYKILEYKGAEFCKILRDVPSEFYGSTLFDVLSFGRSLTGNILETCKGPGKFYSANVSVGGLESLKVFPSGSYKVSLRLHDDLDDNIFNITFYDTLVQK
ncbi:CLUMA_CG015902, isoform A [Clunio marinus]|uniref:CLUMA_CG015902, isoform A n=1 Tax=Clunio marinus TaxID=568069 RepID=A0A1J1IQQ9_9DIPT|nr:CLUMA_CG015902, isoform A [Clunio marinus]